MPPKLHPHQEDAVSKLGNGKVLKGGVGTGKSITAVAYYVRTESPRPIYVITTAKKRNSLDWEKEFAAWAIGKTDDATVAGVLTVDSWNNIGKYTDVRDAFFIFDEQRAVGSGAWADAIVKIARKNRWIMLSATPGDTWLDYVPLFMANGFYPNRTAFIREHVEYDRYAKYPKVRRYHGVGKLVRYKNQLIVDMPYERHTTRNVQEVVVGHDTEALERVLKKRWNVFEHKPLRDMAELFGVARKVVNSDPSRLEYVRSLMDSVPRLIVFYNFDYELEMLRTLGSWSPTQSSSTPIPEISSTSRTTTPSSSSSESSTTSSTTSSTLKKSEMRSTETRRSSSETSKPSYPTVHSPESSASDESILETRTECQTPTPACTTSSGRHSETEALSTCVTAVSAQSPTRCEATGSTTSTTSTVAGSTAQGTSPVTLCSECETAGSSRSTERSSLDSSGSTGSSSRRAGTTTLQSSGSPSESSTSSTSSRSMSESETKLCQRCGASSPGGTEWKDSDQSCTSSTKPTASTKRSGTRRKSIESGSDDSLTSDSTGSSTSEISPQTFSIAEWNGHKHQEVPETDRWVYLVQYTAGAEGWNCITTDTIVFWSLTYSYKMWHQAFGRIDRLNTPFTELHYHVLQSDSWIDQAVRKSLSEKKNFNEGKYRTKFAD